MSDYKDIRIYKGNNNAKSDIKDKDEKLKDNKDNLDNLDNLELSIGFKSTRIFPDETLNNKKTSKSIKSYLKKTSKKKLTAKNLKNRLIYVGDIEQAKIHSKANRPLKKVGEFDSKTQFCKCCGLPCEKVGVMEKYSFRDSTDEFIKHGQVISLYFSFYIYSIFILSYVFVSISLPTLIMTHQRANELNKICNELPNIKNFSECSIYLDDSENSYSSILDYSGLNIKNYKIIYSKLSSNINEKYLDKMFVNYSVLNFIGIIAILVFNLGYILLLNNQLYLPDIDIISPRKYSIIITEMDGFYTYLKEKFLSDNNKNSEKDNKNLKKSQIYIGKKHSERDNLDDNEEIDEISDVEKFKNLFKDKISEIFLDKNQKFNISQINVCFKLNQYIKQEGKLEKCNEYIEKIESLPYQIQKNEEMNLKGDKRNYFYAPLSYFNIHWFEKTKNLSDIQKEKKELEKQIDNLVQDSKKINMDKFAGTVIISFNTIKEKEEFLSHFPKNFFVHFLNVVGKLRYFFCFCCIKKIDNTKFWQKRKIQIDEAPEPEDIVFENLEFTTMKKTYRVVGMNMISLLLIGIGFGIIFGLQNLQNYVKKKNYIKFVYYLISLCITIVSSIINLIFEKLLNFLTKIEKLKSITNYYLSYSVKLSLFSFLISGIIPLICEVISGTENYEILISNMIVMFLVNSIVTPLIWTFNPLYYVKQFQIYLIEKNKNPNFYHNRNQKELNKLYELSDMNISCKYSYITKTLLMTFLYISIFPFGVLISLGGFFFCYFLEKYNYINYYKRPEMLNYDLFFFYVNNFVFFLFFLGVGDYIFLSDIYSTKGWSLANIIILGILTIVPFQFILTYDFIGFKESEINKLTFDDVYLDFYTDYERANPMTKKQGMENYIKKLFENGKIDKKQKDNYLKNIENINLMKAYYENRQNVNLIKIQKMLAPTQEMKLLRNKSFKPSVNNMFKLSGNINNLNSNFKNTVALRGENKGRNIKLMDLGDNSEKANKNELLKEGKKINEEKIIKELVEEEEYKENIENKEIEENKDNKDNKDKKDIKENNENEEKKEKDKSIDKCSQKEIEIQIEEKEIENLKATRHIREYYKDPILLRMASSLRVAELIQTNEDNIDTDNSFGKIDEIDEDENEDEKFMIENLEVENSRICYEMEENEENDEKEKTENEKIKKSEEKDDNEKQFDECI